MKDIKEFSEFGNVTFVQDYNSTCSKKYIRLKLNFSNNTFSALVSDAFDDNNQIDQDQEREDEGMFEQSEIVGKVYFLLEKSTRPIKTNRIECLINNEGIIGYPFVDGYSASDWRQNEFVAKNESRTQSIPSIKSFKWDDGIKPVKKYLNLQLDFQSESFIATVYHFTNETNEYREVQRKDQGSFKQCESNRSSIEFVIRSSKIQGSVTRESSRLDKFECEYSDNGVKGQPIIDSINQNDWYTNDQIAKTIQFKLTQIMPNNTNTLSESTKISSEDETKFSDNSNKIKSNLSQKAPTIKYQKWSEGNDNICSNVYIKLNYSTQQFNASCLSKQSYWMNDTRQNLERFDHGTFSLDECTNKIVFTVEKSQVNNINGSSTRPSTKKEMIECIIDSKCIHNQPRINGYTKQDWSGSAVAQEQHLNSEKMCENNCGNLKCPGKSQCCFLCMKNGPEKHGQWCSSNLIGEWTWNHDGTTPNGDFTLLNDQSVTHRCGWDGMSWHKESKDIYKIVFNDVAHIMKQDGKDNLTLERDQDTSFNGKPISTATRGFIPISTEVEIAKEVKSEEFEQKPIINSSGKVKFKYQYNSTCSDQSIYVILDFSNNTYKGGACDSFDDNNYIDYDQKREDEGTFVLNVSKVIFNVQKSSRTIKSNVIECEVKNDRIIGYPSVDGQTHNAWKQNRIELIRTEKN